MMSRLQITLCGSELCERLSLSREELAEIVSCDIIAPVEPTARDWEFEPEVVLVASRAVRLHRDLEMDWPGVALALQLLDEVEQLRRENRRLRQRLERFEE